MLDAASVSPSDPVHGDSSGDAELARVLEACLADLEAGRGIDPERLVAEHPRIAERLQTCLTTLNLVQQAAAGLGTGEARDERVTPERRLGDFDILREVGRGGMGVVYEARQVSLGRRVALKVLPFAATLDPRQLQRFWMEAQAAAVLHHPHIVPVYSTGCERGVHYYAMQFIDGQTLAGAIAELRRQRDQGVPRQGDREARKQGDKETKAHGRASATQPVGGQAGGLSLSPCLLVSGSSFFRAVARLGVQAAEALEHAHQLGVVHRDVKPANLLIDAAGNVWVTDFGLARLRTHAGLTLTGDVVGTLRYMSPEQALAKRALVDHRTDIYSLGATLYETLTLRPAYPGDERDELLRRIAEGDPPPLRRMNPSVPFDLETVVQKAMAREPERRYATAQELADDLGRFLEHRPVRAVRPSVRERLTKWAWRHKPVLAAVAIVAVLAAGGLLAQTVLLWQEQARTKAALQLARTQEGEARRNGARAEANFRKSLAGLNRLLWELENPRWSKVPGFLDARHEITKRGLEIFQEFVDEPSTDPAVRFQTARAYEILVNVYLLQQQFDDAARAHARAVDLFEGLVQEFPENTEYGLILARVHGVMGNWDFSFGRHGEAKDEYRGAVRACRRALPHDRDGRVHNHLAFLLCDCQEVDLRDPLEAVALATRALALAPGERDSWITLGLAHYRCGEWRAARTTLEKALQLGSGGDARDWLLLALVAWRQGERTEARGWYDRAAAWLTENPMTDELYHFRKEAADLMSIRWPDMN